MYLYKGSGKAKMAHFFLKKETLIFGKYCNVSFIKVLKLQIIYKLLFLL